MTTSDKISPEHLKNFKTYDNISSWNCACLWLIFATLFFSVHHQIIKKQRLGKRNITIHIQDKADQKK